MAGNRIREWRERRGLSYQRLGQALVPPADARTVERLEKGVMNLTQSWMERLAPALGCRAAELLPRSAQEEPADFVARPPRMQMAAGRKGVPTPVHADDVLAELAERLERMHETESLPLNLRELVTLAYGLLVEVAGDDVGLPADYRRRMDRALRAHRRYLRAKRQELLAGRKREPT